MVILLINDDLVMKKRETVIEQMGEELLLFDSSTGKLFELNETGKTIWVMLNGKHTMNVIKEQLREEFDTSQDLNKHLSDFINTLQELDLIEKFK